MPLKDAFNKFASSAIIFIQKQAVKAASSKPGRFLINHAGWSIFSLSVVGDALLLSVYPAPGASYLASDTLWALSNIFDKRTKKGFGLLDASNLQEPPSRLTSNLKRGAGLAGLVGIGFFIRANTAHAHFLETAKFTASMLPGIMQTLSVIAEKDFHRLAIRIGQKTVFKKAFARAAKYPLLTATVPDLLGSIGVASTILKKPHAIKLLASLGLGVASDASVILEDENLVRWLAEKSNYCSPQRPKLTS